MIDTGSINAQINIREVAERAGAKFRGMQSRCPIHGGDNPTAFSIFNGGKSWRCWTHEAECNRYGYDGIALLRVLNNWTMQEVGERYGKPIDPREAARRAAENAKRIEQELQENIERAQMALKELRDARKWLEYHDNLNDQARAIWRKRGLADSTQDFLKFGYSPDFKYTYDGAFYTSPTLSIPTFDIDANEPNNIKHRLLSPIEPKSKYRYERKNIPAQPLFADRYLPLGCANRVAILEGEINGAVTFQTIDDLLPGLQVIGMPSKNQRNHIWPMLAELLKDGPPVWMFPDPDAVEEARDFARMIGSVRMVYAPIKMDDAINSKKIDGRGIVQMMDKALPVR